MLTSPLSEKAKVTALELDKRIVEIARQNAPLADIVQADALEQDWPSLLQRLPGPQGIVSNMPYNITGPLLEKVFGSAPHIERAVLMMQREVADRVRATAGDSNRGALSVVSQALFEVSTVCQVPPGAFRPPPKVHSTVLLFKPKPDATLGPNFLTVVRAGFRHPRKTLANNLSDILDKPRLTGLLASLGLPESVRPHQLDQSAWEKLANLAQG